jgi:hypothetical protein
MQGFAVLINAVPRNKPDFPVRWMIDVDIIIFKVLLNKVNLGRREFGHPSPLEYWRR